jgi:hypothetical protein
VPETAGPISAWSDPSGPPALRPLIPNSTTPALTGAGVVPIWEPIDSAASTGSQMGTTPSIPGHRHRVSLTRCRCASALRPSGPRSSTAPAPRDCTSGPGPRSSTAPAPDWPLICVLPFRGTVVPVPCGYRGTGQMRGQSGQGALRPLTPTAPDWPLICVLRPSGPGPGPVAHLRPSGPVRPRTAPAPGASTALRPSGPGPWSSTALRPRPLAAGHRSGDNTSSHDNPTKER